MTTYLSLMRAEFDYEATSDEELTISEGQLVWVLEDDDSEWYKVKIKSTEASPPAGLVPASYLTPPTPLKAVHALYDYAPARTDSGELENDEELAITEGELLELWEDEGEWVLVGRQGGKGVGFVPGTYVEEGEGSGPAQDEEDDDEPDATSPVVTAYVDPSERVAAAKAAASKAGDVKTWSVTEMDKKKKKKGTLGVGNGAIFFASESDKNPVQQYPLSTLTDLTTEKSKHLHLTFPTAGELHFVISTKDAFDEILAKIEEGRSSPSSPLPAPSPPPAAASPPPALAQRPTASPTPKAAVRFVPPPPPIAAPAAPAALGGNAIALYDFEGEGDDELNVSEGDRLVFLPGASDDPDWVKVRKVGSTDEGVVPASYVQVDDDADVDGADPENDARAAAEAEAEAAAAKEDAARLQQQLIADRAALERATKLKAERAAKELRTQKEQAAEAARMKRLSVAPKAAPIPIPTPHDVDEPPQISARPSKDSRPREAAKGAKPNLNRVRTWKDRTGQFKVDAEYLGLVGNKIRLHKTNGVTIEVPIEKMSGEDKAYINKVMSGEKVDHSAPPAAGQEDRRRDRQPSAPSAIAARQVGTSKPARKHVDWFEFFLNAGCDMDDCTRYGNNFEREKIEESILVDLEPSNLRTLGLREGDILRVLKFIREKFGPPPTPDKSQGDHEARIAAEAAIARQQRGPTPPPPNLFTTADGTLKPRRGRPSTATRQSTTSVDPSALGAAASKLTERTATPPIHRVASPAAVKDPIDKRSSSTIPQMGGFDDDAWTVKGPPSKPTTPAPAPAPAPVVAQAPPPVAPAPTPIQPPSLAPRPESTGPPASTLTYADGVIAGLTARPPSAPLAGARSYGSSGGGSFLSPSHVQAFNPAAPRGPVAPVAANQSLLAPLIPTPTGFRPQFSQGAMMPNVTGFPGMNMGQAPLQPSFTGMPMQQPQQQFSAQPLFGGMQAPMGMQPTGSPNYLQQQPQQQPSFLQQPSSFLAPQQTGFVQPQQTGFMQPQQTGFVQPQQTGFQLQQSAYNQVPARQPVQFNPMPPTSQPAATATAQFQPNNIFASMKDGSFAKGSSQLGPQDPNKYDALRPQPTGMQFAQNGFPGGLQPQQTGFQQPMYPQQTGFGQPGFPPRQDTKQF